MGQDTQTTSTGINNAALNRTLTKVATGLGDLYQPGGSSYVAPSGTTTGGWQASLGAAGNPAFSGGISGALSSYGNRAAGNELGIDDPLYAAQRARLTNDVTKNVNSAFNNSGMFGSDSNIRTLTDALAEAQGGLDLQQRTESYGRQSEAANMLPQLFSAGQLPASIQQSVGASMDADASARQNGQIDYLNRILSPLTGASSAAGTSQTTTTQPDLFRLLLGGGIGLAGLL